MGEADVVQVGLVERRPAFEVTLSTALPSVKGAVVHVEAAVVALLL